MIRFYRATITISLQFCEKFRSAVRMFGLCGWSESVCRKCTHRRAAEHPDGARRTSHLFAGQETGCAIFPQFVSSFESPSPLRYSFFPLYMPESYGRVPPNFGDTRDDGPSLSASRAHSDSRSAAELA